MESVVFILILVIVFFLGWMVGNLVEWIFNARDRRIDEKNAADLMKQMWAERQERE